ncbi:MAG: proteasome-type protease [Aquabacterium sp.]|jgi:putative proteasome-type protease|uniref:proteasome-type protease n=1 Tax=Aquabacterium sp. TaxID=1872578 RepID=UPI002A368669|nr:proteasome-type protease [Aquabacterium sp.]MDX9842139.1 proteasome-type protease [Aquabacterium sp.]
MTYCVAMRLNAGLVFLSDSRTNAGLDQISTFRKMTIYEREGDRVLVMLSAGNLAITQAVKQVLSSETIDGGEGQPITIWTAKTMFDVARIVGSAVRKVHARDADALKKHGIEFNCSLIIGGQIQGETMRLFNVYAAGNFVEAGIDGVCYFQIGESKYGKPVIDRVVTPDTPLQEAAKCALISMDSTLKSNLSVGLPLDLLVYEADSFQATQLINIDESNAYFRMIRASWGQRLRDVFDSIPDPSWDQAASSVQAHKGAQQSQAMNPLNKIAGPDA